MNLLPWKDLEQAKVSVDRLHTKVRSFLAPEEAVGREVPTFFTKMFEFNNYPTAGALSPPQQVVSQQILNDTAQTVRLTSMSYDVTFVRSNGSFYRPRMLTNGVLARTADPLYNISLASFDFEWNYRHERTQRDYSAQFLSRESLGNPEKGNPLTFPCPLELERSDNLTISIKPTTLPRLSQLTVGAGGTLGAPNVRTVKLYITLAGYRVRS